MAQIKSSEIIVAVKAILDADSTLDGYLYADDEGNSKVIMGIQVPGTAVIPIVNIAISTNDITDPDTKFRAMTLDVMIRVPSADYGLVNYIDSDQIADRIKTLLEDVEVTINSGRVQALESYNETDAAPDFDRKNTTLKQISFLVNAI